MTRFARAKGSKSSNEKLAEPASTWSELKQDLLNKTKEKLEQKERDEVVKKRQANYQSFLRERAEEEAAKTSWADFGPPMNGNKVNGKVEKFDDSDSDSDGMFSALKAKLDKVLDERKGGNDSDSDAPPEEISFKEEPIEVVVKKAKPTKKKLKIVVDKEKTAVEKIMKDNANNNAQKVGKKKLEELDDKEKKLVQKKIERRNKQAEARRLKRQNKSLNSEQKQDTNNPEEAMQTASQPNEETKINPEQIAKKLERRRIQREKKKQKVAESQTEKPKELSESDLKKIEKKKERNLRQREKKKKLKEEKKAAETDQFQTETPKQPPNKTPIKFTDSNNRQQSKKKLRDNEQHNRRKLKAETMFINGKSVEVDYIDGFPVKKEDADRLRQLRKEMIAKGLPRSEINVSLKLERRRAEKAFAREKKNVCFKCRKSGHNLSECPALNQDQATEAGGICFKCGSTEHTHFECKVVRGMDYKFATCFICQEQGHISKQCPDNQRGLYPKGGACKVCGDVTHLKKDCPKFQAQQIQLQDKLDIGTMDGGNPDDMDGAKRQDFRRPVQRANKIIKF